METYTGQIDQILEMIRVIRHNVDFFASAPCDAVPPEYQLNVLGLNTLLLKLTKCTCNELIGELTNGFLNANPKKYFFIIYGDKLHEAHTHLLYIRSQLNTESNPGFIFIIRALQLMINKAMETLQSLQTTAQFTETPAQNNFGAHFNRRPLTPGEPEQITPLLIAAGLIPETTPPENVRYCFYGLGVPQSTPVITWLKTAAELSYFVETYFSASNAANKWKIASQVFQDIQNNHFKQKTLKQKLFNYTSKVKDSAFATIETLLLPILQHPKK